MRKCALSMALIGEEGSAVGHKKVLNDYTDGMDNAFSAFVHDETVRNFKEAEMLVVPGAAAP